MHKFGAKGAKIVNEQAGYGMAKAPPKDESGENGPLLTRFVSFGILPINADSPFRAVGIS